MSVYILQLTGGKYYIGYSKGVEKRIKDHFNGIGSEWTKAYKPVKVVACMPGDLELENSTTKKYMIKYGIDNVRGAAYSSIHLSTFVRQALEQEIAHLINLCFRCHKKGHYAKQCPLQLCSRCGRKNHAASNCYAKKHTNGEVLSPTDDSTLMEISDEFFGSSASPELVVYTSEKEKPPPPIEGFVNTISRWLGI